MGKNTTSFGKQPQENMLGEIHEDHEESQTYLWFSKTNPLIYSWLFVIFEVFENQTTNIFVVICDICGFRKSNHEYIRDYSWYFWFRKSTSIRDIRDIRDICGHESVINPAWPLQALGLGHVTTCGWEGWELQGDQVGK